MNKKEQSEVIKLIRKIKRLYQEFEPTNIKIDKNLIQLSFDEDVLELRFNEQTGKLGAKFQTVVDLSEVETESSEPELKIDTP